MNTKTIYRQVVVNGKVERVPMGTFAVTGKERSNVPRGTSRGLGDTIAKVTNAIGVKPCAPCKKRQEYLNKIVPYRQEQQP